jgi:hypothetical protein
VTDRPALDNSGEDRMSDDSTPAKPEDAAQAEDTTKAATETAAEATATTADGESNGEGDSDAKAKFREALERKKGGPGHKGQDGARSKVGGQHGPVAQKRMFRRKSG